MHPILSPTVYSSVPTWQKLKLENRLNNFAALCRTVIQKYWTVTALSLPIWKSKKIWNILKFVQFEWLVSVWPCENNFFWKTVRNVFTISNTKAEISHGSALLLGEKEKKGWLLPQATWQIGSNGFAWCPKKAAQDKYWQYKRWVSHVFS